MKGAAGGTPGTMFLGGVDCVLDREGGAGFTPVENPCIPFVPLVSNEPAVSALLGEGWSTTFGQLPDLLETMMES